MPMDREDMQFFDSKFGGVYKAMKDVENKVDTSNDSVNLLRRDFDVHKAEKCDDVVQHETEFHSTSETVRQARGIKVHEDKYHNTEVKRKWWRFVVGILAGLATISGALWAIFGGA